MDDWWVVFQFFIGGNLFLVFNPGGDFLQACSDFPVGYFSFKQLFELSDFSLIFDIGKFHIVDDDAFQGQHPVVSVGNHGGGKPEYAKDDFSIGCLSNRKGRPSFKVISL